MLVFNIIQMHLLTFVFIILEFGMLVFYQLPHYLSRPEDKSRLYYLVLLLLLLVYNITGGLLPDPAIPVSVKLQNIMAYGSGFLMASYVPYFFYRTLQLSNLRLHALYGVPLFLVLPYLIFFTGYYNLTGDLNTAVKWGMILPFFYVIIMLWAILRAIRVKFKQADLEGLMVRKWEALSVYGAVLPWACMNALASFHMDQWVKVLCTNLGFVLITLIFMSHAVRRYRAALKQLDALSRKLPQEEHFDSSLLRYRFSVRETEIIRLLRQGSSRQAIGAKLFIAPSTVSRHLQNIYYKARVSSCQELLHKLKTGGGTL